MEPAPRAERNIVLLVAAVQFVNILDFMMVMPMGPDFARALGIPTSQLGLIGGSYTAAAAVAGLLGSVWLDRFDRRTALFLAMLGLAVGTAAGGFAQGLPSLLAARVLAGFFGGPATSLALSIVSDVVPVSRRGRAMGTVMGAFSIASVLGVPAGLELARRGGWRAPFFSVAAVGLVITLATRAALPSLRLHLEARAPQEPGDRSLGAGALLSRPLVQLAFALGILQMLGSFILIPNLSSYTQFNLRYPREGLGLLYLFGGSASFLALRVLGPLVDRFGATRVGAVGSVLTALVIFTSFDRYFGQPLWLVFVLFMVANSTRNVAFNTLNSRVPAAHERARYQSLQSAVTHLASAAGATLSSQLLTERPDHSLEGMSTVARVSIALSLVAPFLMAAIERALTARDPEVSAASTAEPSHAE